MKKLLYQFDTDVLPSVFDNVVGFDGGADHVCPYGGVNAANVAPLVDGTVFTRAPTDKKNTAIFIGGSDLAAGESLRDAVRGRFFGRFRVSLMLDCNGANTTAAAAVALLSQGRALRGQRAVILAGTGAVGQRAAWLLAREGVLVSITGRRLAAVREACAAIKTRCGCDIEPLEAASLGERAAAIEDAHIVIAAGAAGVSLLDAENWQRSAALRLLVDINAAPPAGVAGIGRADRAAAHHGKLAFGPLGVGAVKLALHRACIARLFERNDLELDAEEVYAIAKSLVG